jgi:hypothetical protein
MSLHAMTLEDYARLYTFRAASMTMARMISPRLDYRVRCADNDLRRHPPGVRKGLGDSLPSSPTFPEGGAA